MSSGARGVTAAIAAAFLMGLSGCVSNAGWHYVPNRPAVVGKRLPLTLAVKTFQDDRAQGNSTYAWACVIPLVPYCSIDYNRPDTANGFLTAAAYNFRPDSDLASAAAEEMRGTGLFRDVYVTQRSNDPGAQLILRGKITDTAWRGTLYAYLLGPYHALPWLLGLPAGSVDDTLALDLRLVQQSNGKILWTYTITRHYTKTEGIYYNYGEDFGYPEMFRDGMKQATASLVQYITSQPAGFWGAMALGRRFARPSPYLSPFPLGLRPWGAPQPTAPHLEIAPRVPARR
jgi:hypothetical protein